MQHFLKYKQKFCKMSVKEFIFYAFLGLLGLLKNVTHLSEIFYKDITSILTAPIF